MGSREAKRPRKAPEIEEGKVAAFRYRVEVVGPSGEVKAYIIHSANPLELPSLSSKKPGSAEISGKELAKALRSGNVNTMMPGIETFAFITELTSAEYRGKKFEVESGKVPTLETYKKIEEWEKSPSVRVSFERKEGLSKESLGLASLSGLKPKKLA
jgi:hypothetical protein